MMISKQNFVDNCKNKKYVELLTVRDALIRDIRYFEKHRNEKSDEIMCHPSPEVVYGMNLKYLGELCELISEKYNGEFDWGYREPIDNDNLIDNLEELHTTELGIRRIKKNLSLDTDDVVNWCRKKIQKSEASIIRKGKNWYISVDGLNITVNANSFTIITAHKEKK